MLILSRKRGEQILVGDDIEITVSTIGRDRVAIGIEAPKTINIRRKELPPKVEQPEAA